jgi:uroporphyrinogen III methyltransferase/synthase
MSQPCGTVYLVGAGPGDPGLITVRGRECLARADAVIYDYLVNPALLDHAPPEAVRINRGNADGGAALSQQQVHEQMITLAREGKAVVRLKGGDPFVFARGGEEAQVLREAGVPYEVVPGVTAALGAAAYTGIPLTHRDHASAVLLATAHEDPAKASSQLDWELLARFDGTLVFYMGAGRVAEVAGALVSAGKAPATPTALVAWGTLPQQQSVWATLADVAEHAQRQSVTAPAVIIVGPVVELGPVLRWFEHRPLFGQRIVVTRPAHQGRELADRLVSLGAEPILFPTIRVLPPDDWATVDAAIAKMDSFDWLVFTSANGVRYFLNRLVDTGADLRQLGRTRLAAIGPATRDALADYYLHADVMPDQFAAEYLADTLVPQVTGKRILLARASRTREVLPERLADAGAEVDQLVVYQNVDVEEADPDFLERLRSGTIDWITLTSPAIARSLARLVPPVLRPCLGRDVRLASISPLTTQAAREVGLKVAAEATRYTTEGVVQAMINALRVQRDKG